MAFLVNLIIRTFSFYFIIYFSTVTEDFIQAETTFPEDEQIKRICAAFHLSNQALTYDPLELAPQMLGRLGGVEVNIFFTKISYMYYDLLKYIVHVVQLFL